MLSLPNWNPSRISGNLISMFNRHCRPLCFIRQCKSGVDISDSSPFLTNFTAYTKQSVLHLLQSPSRGERGREISSCTLNGCCKAKNSISWLERHQWRPFFSPFLYFSQCGVKDHRIKLFTKFCVPLTWTLNQTSFLFRKYPHSKWHLPFHKTQLQVSTSADSATFTKAKWCFGYLKSQQAGV